MNGSLRRVRGAVGMGLTWAALAIPGFVAGAIFSIVLGIAARHRSFHELSLRRFAAWGAIGGVLLSFLPAAGFGVAGLWRITAAIITPFVLLSAASAAGSLLLARRYERNRLPASAASLS